MKEMLFQQNLLDKAYFFHKMIGLAMIRLTNSDF